MLFGCSEDESGTILPAIDIRYEVWALEEISDMKFRKVGIQKTRVIVRDGFVGVDGDENKRTFRGQRGLT